MPAEYELDFLVVGCTLFGQLLFLVIVVFLFVGGYFAVAFGSQKVLRLREDGQGSDEVRPS